MTSQLSANVVDALRKTAGAPRVALHEPYFGGREKDYLAECIDTTFVSSVGAFVDRFEADLAAFTGARHAVAVVNGTAALHIALKLAGVAQGDEVLVPGLTFVATANAVLYCGAVPHFVDSEERTLGVDVLKLRDYLDANAEKRDGLLINRHTGRTIRAIVPMHTFGHPSDLDGLVALARDYGVVLIEDAAESLGSSYRGRQTGTFGAMATLSFNGNKTITTGGGGAILTDDSALARRAKHVTTTAKLQHAWEFSHDELGYNFRMPNLNAALGCAQLEQLPALLAAKRKLFGLYAAAFDGTPGLRVFKEPEDCRSNYWLQTLVLEPGVEGERDAILQATNTAGYMTRPAWTPLHQLAYFAHYPRMQMDVAQSLVRRIVNIPSSAQLAGVGR